MTPFEIFDTLVNVAIFAFIGALIYLYIRREKDGDDASG